MSSLKEKMERIKSGAIDTGIQKTGIYTTTVDSIIPDPKNERKTFDKLEGLMASIEAVGIVEVPTVMSIGDGKFQLITGHRRFEAWKRLGNDRIQVHIKDSEDDAHALRRKSIVSNVQRQDVNPVEMANALKELLDDANDIESQNDLSAAIGKPKAWVSGMLRILSLPSDLQTKVSRAKLKMSYDTVADIARLDNPTEQEQLIDMVLEGASRNDIRDTIKVVRGQKKTVGEGVSKTKKPKYSYPTKQKVSVILQSLEVEDADKLSPQRRVDALKEALSKARKELKNVAKSE